MLILLAAGTLFTWYWLLRHREGLRIGPLTAPLLAVAHTLVGVACVKVFAVLETLDVSSAGNMSLFGAVFFLPVLYWLGAKYSGRGIAQTFDIFTPCMVFTLLCARINCILTGCCQGSPIPGLAPMRWPTRELEILFYIVLMGHFLREDREDKPPGLSYPHYMIAYGAFRFLTEWFRQSDSPSVFHISHLWAAITFALGLSLYQEVKNKQKKTQTRRKKHA